VGSSSLNSRSIAATPDGKGYWVVGQNGTVMAFGDAVLYGSAVHMDLNGPVVGIAATPDGKGYWLVASDGGVFAFGDAGFYGSATTLKLNEPLTGIQATPDGKGYWLSAADGGVFSSATRASTGRVPGSSRRCFRRVASSDLSRDAAIVGSASRDRLTRIAPDLHWSRTGSG
jgi:hypothetical protein